MNENRGIVPYKKGIMRRLQETLEIVKSKINKNYTLSYKSPTGLQENLDLIINTLRLKPEYLNEIIPAVANNDNKINVILRYCFQHNFTLDQIPDQYFKKRTTLSSIISIYLETGHSMSELLKHIETKGVKIDTFLSSFNKDSKQAIIDNPQILGEIFEHVGTTKVSSIIGTIFSYEELEKIFESNQLPHNIKRLRDLYNIDHKILKDIDVRMLSSKYDNIPLNKLHIFARIPKVQQTILHLNEFELALYYKMASNMAAKTDNWFDYENNMLENFSNGNFNKLLADLYENAKEGNKINAKDIDLLTSIFSSRLAGNLFNITTKSELEQYNEIKQRICDIVLQNPNLDDHNLIGENEKHMSNFRKLNIMDRCKTAILQKNYNLSLAEASDIANTFGKNISKIQPNSVKDTQTIEMITTLRNICECNSIESLMNIGNLNVSADLSNSVALEQQCKELYGKMYQERLYQPNESDFVSSTTYEGKKIGIYKPPANFGGMIVKRVTPINESGLGMIGIDTSSYKSAWNDLGESARFRTCMSYMTPENLLMVNHDDREVDYSLIRPQVILGFSSGIGTDYTIDGIFDEDSVTPFLGMDSLSIESKGTFKTPEDLSQDTGTGYNEVIINTLKSDGEKMQPSFIVYIENSDDEKDNYIWRESQKAALEFDVPIIVLNAEQIMNEQKKELEQKVQDKTLAEDTILPQLRHFIERYGDKELNNIIPETLIRKAIDTSRSCISTNINTDERDSR